MSEGEDLRTFIREIMILFDRRAERSDARMNLLARDAAEERQRYFDELRVRTDEIIAENRAQRQALFRILDRLDGNGGSAAPGAV
jgi:hypothetical protein